MKFEEKLIKLRKEKGMSQEELGDKLNVSRQTISKWETGMSTPDIKKLNEIGKIFNVSLESLTDNHQTVNNINTVNKVNKKSNKTLKKGFIIVGCLLLFLLIVIISVCSFLYKQINNSIEQSQKVFESYNETKQFIDDESSNVLDSRDEIYEITNKLNNELEQKANEINEQENNIQQQQEQIKENILNSMEQMTNTHQNMMNQLNNYMNQ